MTNRPIPRRRFLAPLLAAALLALAVALPSTSHAAADTKKPVDLPAAEAAVALKRLAQQTGVEILFTTEMTATVRTQAAVGSFTAREAAQRILTGTGLAAEQDARTGALTIVRLAIPSEKNAVSRPQPTLVICK